jgi:hypothetical protein
VCVCGMPCRRSGRLGATRRSDGGDENDEEEADGQHEDNENEDEEEEDDLPAGSAHAYR